MDWLYVLMPISGVVIFWPGLIILGLGVGIIGGFFGMGGAWMVTPGLNILGFPMAFAIGTDVAHMAGKSLISTMRHGKFGNVDYTLGLVMLVGTIVGVELGAQCNMWLERIGSIDKVVRWLYVVLLILMAWMVFSDIAIRKRKEREAEARGEKLAKEATGLDWASTLHAIKIPPMVTFNIAGITCSAWLPIIVSLANGWLAGTIVGVELGATMNMWLERIGSIDKVVRWLYVVLLVLMAWMVWSDIAIRKRKEREAKERGEVLAKEATGLDWASTLHAIKIPPMVTFHMAGITCSAWLPILVSLATGWLAGILGIGGGLIRMPALVYLVGCPTHVAVGTDLFEVAISGLYGAASYTFKGRTELVAALIMLVGAAVGAQVGAVATKYIKGYGIRIAFLCAVLGCLCSVVLKLIQPMFPEYASFINGVSTVLVLGFVSAISLYITVCMVNGARAELAAKKQG